MKRAGIIDASVFIVFSVLVSVAAAVRSAPVCASGRVSESRPVHTYSIVARDSVTGEMGVAVQSHWFSVGPLVPWARAGVGAVATQSLVLVSYGPCGLDLMEDGMSASEALEQLLEQDEHASVRQVAMLDAGGGAAAHTGDSCIAYASHRVGRGYSVQANMMLTDRVVPAMAEAFEGAEGDLADRMLAALAAAEREGGDIRGSQSAAILIVQGVSTGEPWSDVVLELRVEDHKSPVEELARLLRLHRAYEFENLGDEAMAEGDVEEARKAYGKAAELAPDNLELVFWRGISLLNTNKEAEAVEILRRVFSADPNWRELLFRLPASGLLGIDEKDLERLFPAE